MSELVSNLASDAPAPEADPIAGVPDNVKLVLRGLSSGQIPGAFVPKDAPKIESGLTPENLESLGIGLYVPKTEGLVAVAFSPKKVSEKMLQKLDASGKLQETFPSITQLIQGTGDGQPAAGGAAPAPGGSGSEAAIPVMPRPSFSGARAATAATRRVNALSQEPSKRTIPGAGAVLNGLVDRPA